MKAVLFGLKSRVAKHFGLISMHNAENAASFAAFNGQTSVACLWEISISLQAISMGASA